MAFLTTAEYKDYKGIESDDEDALIVSLINAAIRWLNVECDRTIVAEADSTRYYHSYNDVEGRCLILDHVLAASPTTVTIDGTALASTEYTLNPRNEPPYDEIMIKQGSTFAWTDDNAAGDYEPEDAIEIVGPFGYYTAVSDPAPADAKHMVRRLVDYAYTQKDAGAFEVVAIPTAGALEIPAGFPRDVARWVQKHRRLI